MTENDRVTYRPQIFDEQAAADVSMLAELRADPRVTVLDVRARQREWLTGALPPPGPDLLDEPFRWVHYPWRSTVVALLGPAAFTSLRLDRNRNKITASEQQQLRALKIGVIGINLGHSIAHTLALEGLCGELRLADAEDSDLFTLNRIPGTLLDLGVNKAVVAARRVAELDPYIDVRVFESGFDTDAPEQFFEGLDIVIEESDALETKVVARAQAKARGIPLIMATNDRGTLDIERYDIDPSRPLFHGVLGDLDVETLTSLSLRERVPYLLRLLDAEKLSPRLIASWGELGTTLSAWPQLGSEAQLAGVSIAAAVRRIGTRAPMASGRVRIDIDELLDSVREPAEPEQGTAEGTGPAQRMNWEVVVTDIATRLMAVDVTSRGATTQAILADLCAFFEVDYASLHYFDTDEHTSALIAESPAREAVSASGAIPVDTDGDDLLERGRSSIEPFSGRTSPGGAALPAHVSPDGNPATYLAAPLVSSGSALGLLALARSEARTWEPSEYNATKAIAALFAQLKMRTAAEDGLRRLAAIDELTGLANRRALIQYMNERFRAGMPGPVATFFIDLDRLKALNDFLGHTAGDRYIQALAARLGELAAPEDMIARLGGDEFVVIPAQPMNREDAWNAAERIQQAAGERIEVGGEIVSRSVSIGITVCDPGETPVTRVLQQADRAVLMAKAAGGNQIVVFSEEMRTKYALHDDIERHLRGAVEGSGLLLHYQPEVDLSTGRILAVEALVRWDHPTRNLLLPESFLEIAEATNLAGELGRWVIRNACAQFAEWQRKGLTTDVVLRINVSPVQLVSLDFVPTMTQLLDQLQLDGSSICLEITEHQVIRDMTRTRITLDGLKQIGVSVAIDDFGTGYSSLAQLKALAVDALKIDGTFVKRLGENPDDVTIVQSIVGLAKSFRLDVIAEGVETAVAASTLLGLGCRRAQGFLLARPADADEVENLLRNGRVPTPSEQS